MRVVIHSGCHGGVLDAPPSKSMAHRALLCAALAHGESRIAGIAPSEDMRATLRALQALGAKSTYDEAAQCVTVQGAAPTQDGVAPLFPPVTADVDCGESGSTLRFVIPLFSLTNVPVTLTGHGRLPSRPQGVYAELFAARGLHFAQTDTGVTLHGALTPGAYTLDGSVSSQFISGLLFALPLLPGDSTLSVTPPFESRSYVQLTLQVLADFGVTAAWQDENTICISGNQKYIAANYSVEGDCSQAAFFAVLAACLPEGADEAHAAPNGTAGTGADPAAADSSAQPAADAARRNRAGNCAVFAAPGAVTLTHLRADTQQGDRVIFDILQRCGARITQNADGPTGGSVTVRPSRGRLRGIDIDLADCPDLGPILMVLGLFCAGETTLRNAGRLRVKESDRIAAMQEEIRKLGGDITGTGDTVRVRGAQWAQGRTGTPAATPCAQTSAAQANGCAPALHPSDTLHGHGDHRIVMSMAVAAVAAGFAQPCAIEGAEAIQKSYPAFFDDLAQLGVRVIRADEA